MALEVLMAGVCWFMTERGIGTLFRLDSSSGTWMTAEHNVEGLPEPLSLDVKCGLQQEESALTLWVKKVGPDVVQLSENQVQNPLNRPEFAENTPFICLQWSVLPAGFQPYLRLEAAEDVNLRFSKINDFIPRSESIGQVDFIIRHFFQSMIDDFSFELLEQMAVARPMPLSPTQSIVSQVLSDDWQLVLSRSLVTQYSIVGDQLYTNCDGSEGASGGVVLDNRYDPIAVTTGFADSLTRVLRDRSSWGVMQHTLLSGGLR